MANKHKIAEPIYQKIAIDIASKIAAGKYKAGEKIYGRSMLAAHYAVSPETIRRAMFMLQDVGGHCWDTRPGFRKPAFPFLISGSGSTVLSAERASQLVSRFRNISTITELKKNIETLSEQQKKQQDDILDNVHQLLEYIEKFRLASPILPYEVKITQDCRFLGQMISEINFWQSTGVTVVAIRKGEELIVSPGPYALFEAGDVFIMVGPEDSHSKVQDYLYKD
jgi:K+/H+ antiporter YhaU regulatory subunit KhtT